MSSARTHTRTVLAFLLTFACVFAPGALAHAGPEDPVVEVQFLVDGEQGNGFLLVTGTLPDDVSLPATLTLPVPPGASPTWVGEITGQGPGSDIEREFGAIDGDGSRAIQIPLEMSRTGQYDALYLPTTVTSERREAILEWIQSVPAAQLLVSVRMPPGADEVSVDPMPVGDPSRNDLGETLYIISPFDDPEVGGTTIVQASYVAGSLLDDAVSGGPEPTLVALLVFIVVLLGALVFVLRRQGIGRVVAEEPSSGEDVETVDADSALE